MAASQGEGASIFRQSAMSRIASADDLDKYIRITNPSAWMVLIAAILLLGGLAFWSITAVIPTTVGVTGIAQDGAVVCWVDEVTANKIAEGGTHATVLNKPAASVSVSDMPLSPSEARADMSSDYAAEVIDLSDWNYEVTIEIDTSSLSSSDTSDKTRLVPVSITVSEHHPIDLVLNSDA